MNIQSFDQNNQASQRKLKIGLGVGAVGLVAAGTIIGLYFGGVIHHSSSSSAPATVNAQQAYANWQSYYADNTQVAGQPSTPNSVWLSKYDALVAANPSLAYASNANELSQELTQFAALTQAQFQSYYTTTTINRSARALIPSAVFPQNFGATLPASLDWRSNKAAVSPVKDQQQCGGCWAFSTAEAVESAYGLANQVVITPLSPQQIISCDTGGNDQGCNGGDPAYALTSYVKKHPLGTEANYPYTSGNGNTGTCDSTKQATAAVSGKGVGVTGITYATPACTSSSCPYTDKAEQQVIGALQNGPISICIDASNWNNYRGGVVDGSSNNVQCTLSDPSAIDHAVQLVGYTSTYWIVKNQWGTSWGDKGYIYLKRGQNTCCVLCEAIQATTTGSIAGSTTVGPTSTPTSTTAPTATSKPTTTSKPTATSTPTSTSKPTATSTPTTTSKPTATTTPTNPPTNPPTDPNTQAPNGDVPCSSNTSDSNYGCVSDFFGHSYCCRYPSSGYVYVSFLTGKCMCTYSN